MSVRTAAWGVIALVQAIAAGPAAGQTTCEPVAARAGRTVGCFITAREELGVLPRDSALFWHITSYPSLEAAAAATTKAPRSTAVASLGLTWLFTIANGAWRPPGGRRIARIGPLPLVDAKTFAAVYMEGVFEPGMHSVVHRHPGAEAWYTLQGAQCLETPGGPPGAARRRARRHGARRPPDAAHRHRHGRAALARAHPAGRDPAPLDPGQGLDAERALPAVMPGRAGAGGRGEDRR